MDPRPLGVRVPLARTASIGRDDTLAALRDLILHADARLLTLTGVGGCGKTRLASDLAPAFAIGFGGRNWRQSPIPRSSPEPSPPSSGCRKRRRVHLP